MVLGHLTTPAADLARRQGDQRVEIAHHARRLPERADQVLSTDAGNWGDVDPRLAANRSIDHSHQCGRDVHDRNTAVPRRCGEPGDVGDHPPADADHDVVAGQTEPGEVAAQVFDRGQRFVGLAVTDREDLGRNSRIEVEWDAVLGDDRSALGRRRNQTSQFAPCPVADEHVYAYMKSYSPYDNLEKKAYPATLVTTSFNDSRCWILTVEITSMPAASTLPCSSLPVTW